VRANPQLQATVVDLPTVTPITTQHIAKAELSERVTARAANALRDPLPTGHDACLAVHEKDGDVYSVDEGRAWLAETGWRFTTHEPLAGPFSLVTAEAI
jgi:hypothetical protein